jgi:hypothetical protein
VWLYHICKAAGTPPVLFHLLLHLVGRHARVLDRSLRDGAPQLELAPLAVKPAREAERGTGVRIRGEACT